MQFASKKLATIFFGLMVALSTASAEASFQIVNVDAKSGPWAWVDGGLNSELQYGLGANGSDGIPDYADPARVKLSDLGISPGDSIYLTFLDGLTSAFGDDPLVNGVNNNGYVGSVFKDAELGSSDQVFPSFYFPDEYGSAQSVSFPELYGNFLQALLGSLTDDQGSVVELFSLGTIVPTDDSGGQGFVFGINFLIPENATYVQFGFNDDIFADNTGSLNVCVSSADDQCVGTPAAVPVPGAIWLFSTAVAGVLGFCRKRKNLSC